MKTFIDIKKEIWDEKKRYFENWLYYCKKIKEEAEKLLHPARILVFGSVVKGSWTPNSDIDVLIISDKLSKNWEENYIYKVKIKSKVGAFSPFQIHLLTSEEYENWYKRFIKDEYVEVK